MHINQIGYEEAGTVIIFAALVIVVILGLIGFAIDTSNLLLTVGSAQAGADSASLAAVSALRNPNQTQGWQDIKKAVIGALSANPLRSLYAAATKSFKNSTAGYAFRYNLTSASYTPNDAPRYDRHSGQSGNLAVTTALGLFCYEIDASSPSGCPRKWCSLENITGPNTYCLTDSVKVSFDILNVGTWLIRVLGQTSVSKIHVQATSYLKVPNSCGSPLCSAFGTPALTSDHFGQHFIPTTPCP